MRDQQVRLLHSLKIFAYAIRGTGRFELFLDLLYVAILANFAENVAEHASGSGLVKYIVGKGCSYLAISDMNVAYTCTLVAHLERSSRAYEFFLQRRPRTACFHPLDHGQPSDLRKQCHSS